MHDSRLLQTLLCRISCLLFLTLSVQGGWERTCTSEDFMDRRQRTTSCSRRLTNIILSVCTDLGGPAGAKNSKRSIDYPASASIRPSLAVLNSIYQNAERANSVLKPSTDKRSMNGQGVTCECCVHRCNINEMREYCANSNRRRKRSSLLFSHLQTENLPVIRSQEDVNAFYEEVEEESKTAVNMPIIDFREFENQPLIRLIERQKTINIAREADEDAESKKRDSSEKDSAEVRAQLKDYLRSKLAHMLVRNGHDSVPIHDEITPSTEHYHQGEDINLLHQLYELFRDEMENK